MSIGKRKESLAEGMITSDGLTMVKIIKDSVPELVTWLMREIERVKEEYFKQMRILFENDARFLTCLEDQWRAGALREAYIAVSEEIRRSGLSLNDKQQAADQDYYWDVIN